MPINVTALGDRIIQPLEETVSLNRMFTISETVSLNATT